MPLPENLLEPLKGPSPAGPFLQYDSADTTYDDAREARREEDDLPQGKWEHERKVADYKRLVEITTEALAGKSKDLQLAVWLTEGLFRREGFAGMAEGLALLRGLVERFWEAGLNPPLDEDGDPGFRLMPLLQMDRELSEQLSVVALNARGHTFLDYNLSRRVPTEEEAKEDKARAKERESALEDGRLPPEAFDAGFEDTGKDFYKELLAAVRRCQEELSALEEAGVERAGVEAPRYRQLGKGLGEAEELVEKLLASKLEVDPDPVEEEPESPSDLEGVADGDPVAGEPQAAAGGEAGAPRSPQDAADYIDLAARFLRERDPTQPTPYLVLRAHRWGELRADPRGVDPRLLAAPPTQLRTRLKGLLLDGRWTELLEQCERVMATPYGRGWLDLQRYVLTACRELGPDYAVVAAAVKGALQDVLGTVPQLVRMTLMDDTPTANAETLDWFAAAGVLGEDDAGGASPETASSAGRFETRLPAGDGDRAVEVLMRRADREPSERGRFLLRSRATQLMVERGMEAVAAPILKEMLECVDRHVLEEWEESGTVALPLMLLFRCLEKLDQDRGEREELYRRACRIDPVLAMRLGPERDRGDVGAAGSRTESSGTEDGAAQA